MKMIILSLLLLMIVSCQDNFEKEIFREQQFIKTRTTNSWEECESGLLKSGEKVKLPWADLTTGSVPDDIRTDIKKANGWRILYTAVEIEGYDAKVINADRGVNYMLFYNIYTGMLKGFVYLETVLNNNNAYWLLSTNKTTKLFNFIPYFAEPMNSNKSPQTVSLSIVSKNGLTQGFEQGWNCFMLELAYDNNSMNEQLSVSGYSLNKSTYTFTGAYQSNSSGTIVSSAQGSSGFVNGLASGFGAAGKQWIQDNTGGNKAIKYAASVAQSVMDKGITGFISSGLYKIFGSLLGTTQSTLNLQFTTNGEVKIQGEEVFPTSGIVPSLSGIPLDELGQNLGLWNLEASPTYIVDNIAKLQKIENDYQGSIYYYKLSMTPSFVVKKNPDVSVNFVPTTTSVIYEKYYTEIPFLYQSLPGSQRVYRGGTFQTLYTDSYTDIKNFNPPYVFCMKNLLPKRVVSSNTPALSMVDEKLYMRENMVLKVQVMVNTSNGTVYSTKSFVSGYSYQTQSSARPYSWTYQELMKLGY